MFEPVEIANRIKQIAKENNTTVKSICSDSGVGEKFVSNMGGKNGSYPQSDKITKIADYLHVSVDYLLGRTDIPTSTYSINNKNTTINGTQANVINNTSDITNNEIKILELFKHLTPTQQGELIGRAKMMIEQNESVFSKEDAG